MWALVLSYRNGMTKTIRELQEYVPDQETETSIMNKTFSQEEEEETNENEENENNERSRSRSRSPARDKSHVKTRTRSP
jgi:CO dehydrogenase/acetyl-CoA synthase beta subunit